MSESPQEDRVRIYIETMRLHFATYHNHKEQMAYIATGLYLTGVSALFFQKPLNVTNKLAYQCAIIAIVVIVSGTAIAFVWQQLMLRAIAADIIAACDFVRLTWLEDLPPRHDTTIPVSLWTKHLKIDMPWFLWHELDQIRHPHSLTWLTHLTVWAIFFSGSVLVARLLLLPP